MEKDAIQVDSNTNTPVQQPETKTAETEQQKSLQAAQVEALARFRNMLRGK